MDKLIEELKKSKGKILNIIKIVEEEDPTTYAEILNEERLTNLIYGLANIIMAIFLLQGAGILRAKDLLITQLAEKSSDFHIYYNGGWEFVSWLCVAGAVSLFYLIISCLINHIRTLISPRVVILNYLARFMEKVRSNNDMFIQ